MDSCATALVGLAGMMALAVDARRRAEYTSQIYWYDWTADRSVYLYEVESGYQSDSRCWFRYLYDATLEFPERIEKKCRVDQWGEYFPCCDRRLEMWRESWGA